MNDLRLLVEKYMDGLTTRNEEEQLRRYFTSLESMVPDDLEWMSALKDWEKSCAKHEFRGGKNHHGTQDSDAKGIVVPRTSRLVLRRILRIAAMLLVVVSATLLLWPRQKSFAIIDGQRVTSREVVQEEALEALNMVSSTDEETFEALFDSP